MWHDVALSSVPRPLGPDPSPCLSCFLSPCLSSSSPAPDGQHSGEDTGKGRCVYLLETKRCAVADGGAPEQAVHSDTVTLQWSLFWELFFFKHSTSCLRVHLEFGYTNLAIRTFCPIFVPLFNWCDTRINTSSVHLFKLHVGFLEAPKWIMWMMKMFWVLLYAV